VYFGSRQCQEKSLYDKKFYLQEKPLGKLSWTNNKSKRKSSTICIGCYEDEKFNLMLERVNEKTKKQKQ